MESKSRVALTLWGGLSLVMFLAAALLTWKITSVHGRVPFSPDRANFPESFQTVDIYYRPGSVPAGKMVGVNFEGIDGAAEAGLSMSFPAKADVKIFVDHLAYPTACSSPRSADQVIEEAAAHRGINVSSEVVFSAANAEPLYLVIPKPSDYEFYVHCVVRPVTETPTYNKREASFSTFAVTDDFPNERTRAALDGYGPLPSFLMRVLVEGADNVKFNSGFEERRLSGYEQARIIPHGSTVTVYWTNVYSEQMRDVVLIVIGSLIAIGATMLIEVIRPMVERIGERRSPAIRDSAGEPET